MSVNWRAKFLKSVAFVLLATPGIPFHAYFPLMFVEIALWEFREFWLRCGASEGDR